MTNSKHSPAPWTAEASDPDTWTVYAADDHHVATCVHDDTRDVVDIGTATVEANARMLAAAPDLRDALCELLAEWDAAHAHEDHRTGITPPTAGIEMARDALARAAVNRNR